MRKIVLTLIIACTGVALAQQASPKATDAPGGEAPRGLTIDNKPWTGDFDAMLERRVIRVLVPRSRTLYYTDKGHEKGLTAGMVREFEQFINRKYARQLGKRPITVYMLATTRSDLVQGVAEGLGDIAAGNITVTDTRLKLVDFVAPEDQKPVSEVVVTDSASAPVASADDLSGRMVHVRKSSSYYESLQALNERLVKEKKAPVRIQPVPEELEDEDLMEMLNAGLIQTVVVDDWKAKVWAQILPKIRVNDTARVREGGRVGWAIRKQSPRLQAEVLDFYKTYVKKEGGLEYRFAQTMRRVKQIKNNTNREELKRFEQLVALFRKYGEQYNFDPIMLAAQGFQESQLNQGAKSQVGAIGVMQLMPQTGAELKVGDISVTEPNIHAGAKYMDQLMSRYFPDASFNATNRPLFAFASYNAGPGNISKMRKEAEKRGLDPNKWFENVEVVTADRIGIETTTYVRNIYKYYIAYTLSIEAAEAARKAREQVAPVRN